MALYTLATDTPTQADFPDSNTDTVQIDEKGIRDVEIFITEDSYTEVKAGLFFGDKRIFPDPAGKPIQKPGTTGPVPLDFILSGVPNELELQAWAPDADFSHRAVCNIEAIPPDELTQPVRIEAVGSTGGNTRDTPSPEDIMSAGENG